MIAGIAIAIARAIERDFVLTKVPALFRRFVVRLGVSVVVVFDRLRLSRPPRPCDLPLMPTP